SSAGYEGGRKVTAEVKLWEVSTGNLKRTVASDRGSDLGPGGSVAFSPDGKILAAAEGKVKLWNVETAALRRTLISERAGVTALAFSPDGNLLAGADGYLVPAGQGATQWISEASLWNVQTGKVEQTLTELSPWLRSVAFSPDGKMLATGSSGPIKTSPDRTL